MKALVLACVLALGACGGVQNKVEDARAAVGRIVHYAQVAEAATEAVCEIDPKGQPCRLLTQALDEFFAKAQVAEDALNAGEAVDLDALEAEIKTIYAAAVEFGRSLT